MSGRDDLYPSAKTGWRRLSYTRRCGFVDWGHALPDGPASLKRQLDQQASGNRKLDGLTVTLEGAPAFVVEYGQSMGSGALRVSTVAHWIVRKGLTADQRKAAALGIYMTASHRFEGLQAAFPFFLVTDSGYSAEDLLSNVIGFYRAYNNVPEAQMRTICGEVSVEEGVRIWDEHLPNGIGALKNRTTNPMLFPTTEGVTSPSDTEFPMVLKNLRTSPAGNQWVGIRDRFIDNMLITRNLPLNVSRSGIVTPVTQTARLSTIGRR